MMKKTHDPLPPSWAQQILRWYCRPDLLEDLEGDLNEYFLRHCETNGPFKAKLIYVIDVFKFFRSYTVRKPDLLNTLIHWLMLNSYIKTSGRNIVRNKLFSTINIIGLAISMSVGLLLISFLTDLLSYDRFHEKGARMYRVSDNYSGLDGDFQPLASTSVRAGKLIKQNISGIEEVVILRRGFGKDARVGNTVVPLTGLWADDPFFDVFSFKLLQGDAATALTDPYSIVLTDQAAKKLFGETEPLGNVVQFDTVNYTVTGVVETPPKFSHIQFEVLVSFSTKETIEQASKTFLSWESIWMNYVYLVLPENTNPDVIQASLDRISKAENVTAKNHKVELWLQPLHDIALGKDMSNQIGPVMDISIVYVVAALAFVVLLSACFNYTNLSLARAMNRSREVGIRKVIGALKSHVLYQFVVEAVIVSLLALICSVGVFMLIKPHFISMDPALNAMVSLDLSFEVVVYFIVLAVVVGIMGGIFPAMFFSRIQPARVLKDASTLRAFRHVSMRKVLITIQYTLSLVFISATLIGYKQYKHMLAFDLGFSTENVLNIDLQGNDPEALLKDLSELPEVQTLSRSLMITSVGDHWGSSMKYNNPHDSSVVYYNSVDENYQPLHGHKILAGRNFTAKVNKNQTEVLVNEQVLKRFNIGKLDPSKALGEVIEVDGKKLEIIGVLKDFHYGKVDREIQPVILQYLTSNDGYINAKILSTDWQNTFSRIEKIWKKHDTVHSLEATFYDEQIEKAYGEFSAMLKVIGFLSFLAISIASLGLLGMVVFTTESKLREISIRKVLGATETSLVYLVSRGFLQLLLLSIVFALPATYFFFDQVVLPNITYSAPIGLQELVLSVVVVLTLAFLMIGTQLMRIFGANPAEVLKAE